MRGRSRKCIRSWRLRTTKIASSSQRRTVKAPKTLTTFAASAASASVTKPPVAARNLACLGRANGAPPKTRWRLEMANTYRALAVLLSYPTSDTAALIPEVAAALEGERLVPAPLLRKIMPILDELSADDLYDAQSRYVDLFDRTRSLSLQLYEHVHGESRDRGQAMVELLKLYSSRGLELTAKELPD